jgi:endonuclease/exonuclease/phosphatase family metal-dependent hydrolase
MKLTVLNWNIGGAKFFETGKRADRKIFRDKLNRILKELVCDSDLPKPDVVTLQEIVQYQEDDDEDIQDIIDNIPGYYYFPFILIDSKISSSKAKWEVVKKNSDWGPNTYFAQGNAFLIKKEAPLFKVWDLSNLDQDRPEIINPKHYIEKVHLDSGLYFGDRNTEPRASLVAHFIYDPTKQYYQGQKNIIERKPFDIFVVNVHLTTLKMEREGVPEIDTMASKIRQGQLDVIFNGIVSRYISWRLSGYKQRGIEINPNDKETFDRYSPVWIIAGDFNFTEESSEYESIKRMNFIDTVPPDGKKTQFGYGTKSKGREIDPTLNLDYIFAGPKFVSLSSAIGLTLYSNRVIHDHRFRVSDHYPVLSVLNLNPQL